MMGKRSGRLRKLRRLRNSGKTIILHWNGTAWK
jgi:hypothetical protein